MSKKINAPPVWREEITQYLDVLKAGGQSKGTLTTRRCQLSQMDARRLIQPKRCQASDVRTRTRALVRIA